MQKTYSHPEFAYVQSDEQRLGTRRHHLVVTVGAGQIGLTAALDCAQRGMPVVVLDDNNTVSVGARAVCYARRSLEIWDRPGVAAPMVDKGVSWQAGKVSFQDDLVYSFDLLPQQQHKMPAAINLQRSYVEETLVEAYLFPKAGQRSCDGPRGIRVQPTGQSRLPRKTDGSWR